MLHNITKRLCLLTVLGIMSAVNAMADDVVAKIGDTEYATLAEAVNAATTGQTIEITTAGTYTLPSIPNNITIKGGVEGVEFSHTSAGNIAGTEAGVTFKNVTFSLGTADYHGFTSAGAIIMEECTINGKLFTYHDITFNKCTFNAQGGDYSLWIYFGNNPLSTATFTDCKFFNTVKSKFLNVFHDQEINYAHKLVMSGCTFNSTGAASKSALNVKATNGYSKPLNYDISITDCTTEGTFPTVESPSDATCFISSLVQVDDQKDGVTDGLSITVDGVKIYENGAKVEANNESNTSVAKIGSTEYATLQAAVDAAESGATITLLKDFTLTTKTSDVHSVVINKSLTIDGGGYTITSPTDRRPLAVSGKGNDITIKNLTVVNKYQTACLNFLDELTCTLDNVTLDNSSAGGSYNQPITINSTIEGTGKVTLNITNGSVVKTNDDGKAHYAIIVWHPADITITNSTIKGWAAVYVKPQGAGTNTTISNSTLESHGYSGYSNAFGMFVTESGNNSFTLTNNTYTITADNNYDALFMLKGNSNNVIQILGENNSFTSNEPFYGGLTDNWSDYYANSLYMDESSKNYFSSYIDAACTISVVTEGEFNGLYKIGYIPEVYYYWDTTTGQEGGYYNFADPFTNSWLANGEYITLQKNITLTANIACALNTSESFTLTLGEYTITKGEYSVSLNDGVTVKTDKQTDIFSAVTESSVVVEKSVSGGYEYTVVDGTEYTITGFADENGNKVEASAEKAIVDTEITLTITTADGYTLTAVSADNGATLAAVEGDATKRTFTMPAGNVTIKAEFAQTETIDESTQTVEEGTKVDNSNATITNVEVASETETTTVTVSGTVDGAPVTEIANGAFASLAGTAVESVDLTATAVTLTGERSTSDVLKDIPETALIYLPATSNVSGDNVVIKDAESNYTCNNFVMLDEKSYSVPTAFTATTATLQREFTAGVTCTVCLPYNVEVANVKGKIYKFSSIDGTTMKMTEDNDGLDANVPYIYVPDGTDNISQTGGSINVAISANNTNANDFTFIGNYSDKTFSADEIAAGIYGFSAEAAHGATSVGQFVKGSDGAYIKGMRAYLKYTGAGSDPGLDAYGARADEQVELPDHFDVVLVDADGTTTNIGRMELTTDEDGAPAYNLNGQRVVNSMRGIIIKNGKKTFVK